jgi:hypothetical protein
MLARYSNDRFCPEADIDADRGKGEVGGSRQFAPAPIAKPQSLYAARGS